MLLQVSNLNCQRADKLILSGVSLSVDTGDCLILRGPNGAGKTTLLRALAGLGGVENNENTAFSGHLDAIKSTLTEQENLPVVHHSDLNIDNARILNVIDFAAKPSDYTDPFLQGVF